MSLPSMQQKSFAIAAIAAVAALLVWMFAAGCGGDDESPAPMGNADATITIVSGAFNKGLMAFSPDTTTVQVNQTVRMTNGDALAHTIQTITAGGPTWGTLSPGASVDRTVTQAGTFDFRCTIAGHTMTGTVIVTP